MGFSLQSGKRKYRLLKNPSKHSSLIDFSMLYKSVWKNCAENKAETKAETNIFLSYDCLKSTQIMTTYHA